VAMGAELTLRTTPGGGLTAGVRLSLNEAPV